MGKINTVAQAGGELRLNFLKPNQDQLRNHTTMQYI